MRAGLLLLVAASAVQGCTVLAAGTTADLNRQRRAAATTDGAGLAERPASPLDRLVLHLASGERIDGVVQSQSADSLVLAGRGAVALRDVSRAERAWVRADGRLALALGALADFASLYVIQGSLSLRLTGLRL